MISCLERVALTLEANFVIDKQKVSSLKGLNCIVSHVDNQQPHKLENNSPSSAGKFF